MRLLYYIKQEVIGKEAIKVFQGVNARYVIFRLSGFTVLATVLISSYGLVLVVVF